jgi:hemerythrin
VLLRRASDQAAVTGVAERLIASLRQPIALTAGSAQVGVSIGIAAWPQHAASADALVTVADLAMYQAKRSGKNMVRWAEGYCTAVPHDDVSWSDDHAVGIAEIDAQHQNLMRLIGRVSAAIRDDRPGQERQIEQDALVGYTAFHFAAEERLMAAYGVEDAAHCEEHRCLLRDLRNVHIGGDITSISLVLRYLQEWVVRHIDGSDRRLGQALRAKGCR